MKAKLKWDQIEALLRIPLGTVPDEAREYLAARPNGPSPGRRTSWTESESGPRTLGKYRLLRRIGQGGMAEVFVAHQFGPRGFEKKIALKRILPHLAQREEFVDMFLREARLAARISHSNVVQILDLGKINEHYFIAMEYIRGWDLNTVLGLAKKLGIRIPLQIACRIVIQMCNGLGAAHTWTDEQGRIVPIIHRDISPHNVLISTDGIVKLSDFGIAKVADSVDVTTTGEVRGKASYMAPERVRMGKEIIDERSDIFSVGVVLFESLTLVPLFRREDKYRTMQAIAHAPIPQLRKYRDDVPPELQLIVERALARRVEERTPSAHQLISDLEDLLAKLQAPSSTAHLSSWLRAIFTKGVLSHHISADISLAPVTGLTEEIVHPSSDSISQRPSVLSPGTNNR
jgi:serine/threonine-protein kinase